MGVIAPTPPLWVDTHCHLQLDQRDPAQLLERASNVSWVVAPGVDLESSLASIELARRFPGRVLATAGLHPHEASEWGTVAEAIAELSPQVVAIGETGLDFYRMLSPQADQVASLTDHIDLAVAADLPLIVHCRDAFEMTHQMLEHTGVGPRTVLHSWTGGRRWTKRFLDLGVTFSFSGTLAFETAETIRLGAELVPPGRAMVETDTPYLAPPPHRGEPNEPAWVAFTGQTLAQVWGLSVEAVAEHTSSTASRVFRSGGSEA